MARKAYLIDSNAVIDFLGNRLPKDGMNFLSTILDSAPAISVISQIELLGFTAKPSEELLLRSFVDDVAILPLNQLVVEQCITLRKANKIKLPDALIAATALAFNLTLVTRNVADFKHLENIEVINPHHI